MKTVGVLAMIAGLVCPAYAQLFVINGQQRLSWSEGDRVITRTAPYHNMVRGERVVSTISGGNSGFSTISGQFGERLAAVSLQAGTGSTDSPGEGSFESSAYATYADVLLAAPGEGTLPGTVTMKVSLRAPGVSAVQLHGADATLRYAGGLVLRAVTETGLVAYMDSELFGDSFSGPESFSGNTVLDRSLLSVEFPYEWGTHVYLDFSYGVVIDGYAPAGSSSWGMVDFSSGIQYDRIEILDSAGVLLEGYAVDSQSLIDYAPVAAPEPGVFGTAAAALLVAACLARRLRQVPLQAD